MHSYIKKLQSKPESTRKQIFFGSLAISMFFVGFIWISSFGYKFNKENTAKADESIKPFALFGQTLSGTYSDITASVGKASLSNKQIEANKDSGKVIDLIPVENQ